MKIKEIKKNTDTKSRVTYLNLKKGVRMFGKKIEIGEGQKYDVTKVSTESVNQEEVAKKNAKLIEIFKRFDISKDGKLDSTEMAMAMDYFYSLDESGDDKISKKEFQEAAEAFNEEMQLTGKDKVDAKDLKTFIKNLFSATKNDPTEETQKLLSQYLKEQQNIQLEEKQRLIDDDAKRRGWEWSQDGAYWDKEDNKYYLPNEEGTKFVEVHWSDSEQRFKVMSAEELAELNAALEKQRAEQEAARQADEEAKNKTYGYVVQSDDKFTEVMTKVLQAQGIENPTEEQIAEAKEQFKKDNPNAIRTTSSGYEFLMVGEQVKLRGEVEYAKNSQEAVAQWAQDHPDKVWKPETEDVQEEAAVEEDPQAKAEREELEELANGSTILDEVVVTPPTYTKEQIAMADEIEPNFINQHPLDDELQSKAVDIRMASDKAVHVKNDLYNRLKSDVVGASGIKDFLKANITPQNVAYVTGNDIAQRIDNVMGLDKKDVYEYILTPLKARAEEIGLNRDMSALNPDMELEEMQKWISMLSDEIKHADAQTVSAAEVDEQEYYKAKDSIQKVIDNKELFRKSNLSLARVADMAENNPDSVTRGTTEKGSEYCSLEDGTEIFIKRDKEGNIISVRIYNPGGPDNHYDISYNASGTVFFDPDGKYAGSGGYKEKIEDAPFDFDKIKALAERIFGAKPKAAEE